MKNIHFSSIKAKLDLYMMGLDFLGRFQAARLISKPWAE